MESLHASHNLPACLPLSLTLPSSLSLLLCSNLPGSDLRPESLLSCLNAARLRAWPSAREYELIQAYLPLGLPQGVLLTTGSISSNRDAGVHMAMGAHGRQQQQQQGAAATAAGADVGVSSSTYMQAAVSITPTPLTPIKVGA
jgi:hypothetical protein